MGVGIKFGVFASWFRKIFINFRLQVFTVYDIISHGAEQNRKNNKGNQFGADFHNDKI